VVTDAPVEEAIASSPLFAPQVAKVLAPQRWITVSQVRDALAAPEAVPRG
jgi:energy-coupling factor transport system ATP-binding protein